VLLLMLTAEFTLTIEVLTPRWLGGVRWCHSSVSGILQHHFDNTWKADITIGKSVDQ
jgi:hypothetical protein